jgi:hypothetical protein
MVIGIKRIQAVGLLDGVPTLAELVSGQYPASWNHDSIDIPKYQLVGLTSAGVPTLLKLASDGSLVS